MESRLGRLAVDANEAVASAVRSGSRLASAGIRDDVCLASASMPYRPATTQINRLSGRAASGDDLPLSFVTSLARSEGAALSGAREAQARRVLSEAGAFDGDGVPIARYRDALPEPLRQGACDTVSVGADATADAAVAGLSVGSALTMGIEELRALVGTSAPYSGGARGTGGRRSSRKEVGADAKAAVAAGHVVALASLGVADARRILSDREVERDSAQCCYISVDAVLVDEQCAEHVRGGRPEARSSKTYVKHWDARIEADGRRHDVTSTDEDAMWVELMAALVENGLLSRRLVFIVDGETRITDQIERRFAPWGHDVFLDWYHLQDKIYQLMSSMIRGQRVDDPDAEVEYYKRGKNRGKPKPCRERTSLSRLYAKEACLIAWAGNVAQLIAYVRCIPDGDVKDETARARLLGYLERKGAMITCYSLRRKLGLRNSSNGSEQLNQLVVSQRQKQGLMSWREAGSGALAQLSALYLNGSSHDWFSDGTVAFGMACIGEVA